MNFCSFKWTLRTIIGPTSYDHRIDQLSKGRKGAWPSLLASQDLQTCLSTMETWDYGDMEGPRE